MHRRDDSASDRPGTPSVGSLVHDARVFKAGNSLAIRIPRAVAKSVGLEDGSPVEIAVHEEAMVVRRAAPHELRDLIARITPENVHEEVFSNFTERERW
jgi:antitoxin MazE